MSEVLKLFIKGGDNYEGTSDGRGGIYWFPYSGAVAQRCALCCAAAGGRVGEREDGDLGPPVEAGLTREGRSRVALLRGVCQLGVNTVCRI